MKLEVANTMSLQQLFDYAIEKMVEQGKRCLKPESFSNICMYGDNKGNHCGIGWMLDEDKDKLMEYTGTIDSLIGSFPDDIPIAIKNNPEAADAFQQLHDKHKCEDREVCLLSLQKFHNIDTSNPAYFTWVSMGQSI